MLEQEKNTQAPLSQFSFFFLLPLSHPSLKLEQVNYMNGLKFTPVAVHHLHLTAVVKTENSSTLESDNKALVQFLGIRRLSFPCLYLRVPRRSTSIKIDMETVTIVQSSDDSAGVDHLVSKGSSHTDPLKNTP